MAVRSDRLAGPTDVPGVDVLLFVVPVGETWLVKRVVAQNTGAAASDVAFEVRVGGVQMRHYTAGALPPSGVDDYETWWALDPGCELHAVSLFGTTFRVAAYGAKLSGTAP